MAGVYVYWFHSQRAAAEAAGVTVWSCKIGHTSRDVLARVKEQCTSAYETPEIGLIIATTRSADIEHAIHIVLRLRGRTLDTAPGREWFRTSPEEVADIYRLLIAGNAVPTGEGVLWPPYSPAVAPPSAPAPPAHIIPAKLAAAASSLVALDVARFALDVIGNLKAIRKGVWFRRGADAEALWIEVEQGDQGVRMLVASEPRDVVLKAAEAAEDQGSGVAKDLRRLAARLGQRAFLCEVVSLMADICAAKNPIVTCQARATRPAPKAAGNLHEFLAMDEAQRKLRLERVEGAMTHVIDLKKHFLKTMGGAQTWVAPEASVLRALGYRLEAGVKVCRSCLGVAKGRSNRCCEQYSVNNRMMRDIVWDMQLAYI